MGAIDEILEAKRKPEQPAAAGDKFFSVMLGEGLQENFLEIQFRDGIRTCLSYSDLMWFNYDPKLGVIDLEFGGFLVIIEGRALYPKLFQAIKSKRVAWVKEADSEMQDHDGNECYISEIIIKPPKTEEEEKEAAAKAAKAEEERATREME